MDLLSLFVDWFIHLDKNLISAVDTYGYLVYGLLFAIIFLETGIVVTPFLPGDSLLFAAGALSSAGSLNLIVLWIVMTSAAIIGDTVNYWIGHSFGKQVMYGKLGKWIKKEHIEKTQRFYDKYGAKTVVLARFMPFARTLAPFLAGTGKMEYSKFAAYNVLGGVAWVSIFLFGGYLFGDLPFVKNNFSWVILAIIVTTLIPIVFEWIKSRRKTKFKREN